MAELGRLDELQRAGLARLRAQMAFAERRGSDAPRLLLDAANKLGPLDSRLARETYLEALGAAILAGRLNRGGGEVEAARSALAAPPGLQPPHTGDLLLDGLAIRFTDGDIAGAPQLKRALHALRQGAGHDEGDMHWLWLACRIAADLWDDETWNELTARQVQLARDAGALNILPIALTYRAGVFVHVGEFAAAAALIEEAAAITNATGAAPFMYTSLVLAAWRGQEARALELIAAGLQDAAADKRPVVEGYPGRRPSESPWRKYLSPARAPDAVRDLGHQAQLVFLGILADLVARSGRGKPALRRQRKLF